MVVGAAGELWEQGRLRDDILVSLTRVYSGWLIGSAIAIPIGLLAGTSRYARAAVDPFIHFFRFIPALALTSLFILWFGIIDFLWGFPVMQVMIDTHATGVNGVWLDNWDRIYQFDMDPTLSPEEQALNEIIFRIQRECLVDLGEHRNSP